MSTNPLLNPRRYRAKLNTLRDVKSEVAKLYRECRSDLLDPSVASKLAYLLQIVGKLIESSDLETRIKALEDSRGV